MRNRLIGVIAGTAVLGVLIGLYIAVWATQQPTPITATPSGKGSASLTLQTVAAVGPTESPQHPDWVSYLVQSHGRWIHSTVFTVPAHSLVRVTIYQFDGDSGLRNPFISQATGTVGGAFTMNGKTL